MKTMATLVKAMLALAGLAVTALWVSAMLLVALIEVLIKALIPIAVVIAVYLILRARRRHAPQAAGPTTTTGPVQQLSKVPAEPAPPKTIAPARALPSVQTHKHRSYVVVGRDHGFTAPATEGYLRLDAATPCAPATADHSALLARHLGRRPSRSRGTRP
ncbi:hypothetical protein [Mycobacteroides abscessus]|uniref:hypothetical protein n=2 Tax=Mycobacteroides abscessus TaxID=36809 RepID=UPI000925D674|nr:hypothetical protein [Mycobacteroides abscessus]SHW37041.1 Uncharacterised protein [Mycobacteroides abscessus subsp. abscessus]SIE87684.1 Uncharacterised protein [Mycobacteroides abscessus subsp. abscessus]SII12385.1 Uncharacterised protein [Mycobacteroides abscessus subsp. abscessus]SIK93149.1 Uncharacterised protein [Mycobacteroides abscessus subsp. abscessus]SIN02169.1 Uncharacterised protein [Mycobacteroides abscessus subsp. abscessus]